ncbi:MAG: AAA family ATPase [bacterium]|nr:AAA family ATPase [bacterium]
MSLMDNNNISHIEETGSQAGASVQEWEPPDYSQSSRVRVDYQRAEDCHCLLNDKMARHVFNSIKILRTRMLSRARQKGWRTILITSARPGEGKTVTAINLAFALAKEHQQTVVLVDGDLRRPSVADYLGIPVKHGLSDYFLSNIPLDQIILWPGVEKLTLVPGRQAVSDSAELIGSPAMQELVREMKDRYLDRYILFDFPSLLGVADTLAFMPYVDCVLMVVEAGKTASADILQAQSLIPEEKLLGLVLNKAQTAN